MSLYDDLGVDPKADQPTIKRAYRRKAQKAHPDKGGSLVVFQALTKAYETLSDEEKRARYDETGETGQPDNEQAKLLEAVAGLLFQAISQSDVDHTNLLDVMRKTVNETRAEAMKAISVMHARIKKDKAVLKRLKSKGNNLLARFIESDIKQHEAGIKKAEERIEFTHKTLEFLKGYDYKFDQKPVGPSMFGGMPMMTIS